MENAFYIALKAFLGLRIFDFLYWIFIHVEKWLD